MVTPSILLELFAKEPSYYRGMTCDCKVDHLLTVKAEAKTASCNIRATYEAGKAAGKEAHAAAKMLGLCHTRWIKYSIMQLSKRKMLPTAFKCLIRAHRENHTDHMCISRRSGDP